MKFTEFKIINEAQFNSKQEVIDHFVRQGKTAAQGAAAWERGYRGSKPKPKKPTGPVRSYHDDLDDKRYGETNEAKDPCWKDYKQVGMKKKGGKQVPNCVPKESIAEDWQKTNQQDKTDGMSQKAVNAYRKENPGSKLKTAVTKKPSELKAGSKDANRRKSFCARMSGNKGPMKDEKGRPTPKAKALSRWNCESIESLEAQLAEAALGTAPKRPARPGARPDRGHTTESRYKYDKKTGQMAQDNEDPDQRHGLYIDGKLIKTVNGSEAANNLKKRDPRFKNATVKKIVETALEEDGMLEAIQVCEYCGCHDHTSLDESGKASRALCTSSKPDADLGASQLASCKAQGLRAREGEKSHKIGKSRVKVGGHKIKGKKYGGPIPDWS